MSIQTTPLLQRNIERAIYLELPFALHIRNSIAGRVEHILIRCFDQSGLPINYESSIQNHNYHLIPEAFLTSESTYLLPLDASTNYTPLEIILRSTDTYSDKPFESLLEHKNQSCGPEGEPPCEACIRRVHSLVLLGQYFSTIPTYYTLIKSCLDIQISKWPASRPQSCTPSSRPQSCTPSSRPQSCTPSSRPQSCTPSSRPQSCTPSSRTLAFISRRPSENTLISPQ